MSPPSVFTASELTTLTTLGDPSSCYIALFDGPDGNSEGGVYLVSPAWYAGPPNGHPGGNFDFLGACGRPIFNWTSINPSHGSFITSLLNDADFVQAGAVIATYMGEFIPSGP
jgi:hypothetical protein